MFPSAKNVSVVGVYIFWGLFIGSIATLLYLDAKGGGFILLFLAFGFSPIFGGVPAIGMGIYMHYIIKNEKSLSLVRHYALLVFLCYLNIVLLSPDYVRYLIFEDTDFSDYQLNRVYSSFEMVLIAGFTSSTVLLIWLKQRIPELKITAL